MAVLYEGKKFNKNSTLQNQYIIQIDVILRSASTDEPVFGIEKFNDRCIGIRYNNGMGGQAVKSVHL